MNKLHTNPLIIFISSIALLVFLGVIFEMFPMASLFGKINLLIIQSGIFGPILFICLFTMAVIIPPVPERPLVLSAGFLFGPWLGTILTIIGATLGASVNFLLARRYGHNWISNHNIFSKKVKYLYFLGEWKSIIFIRMFAGFTFDWYSYLLGFLQTRFLVFIVATILGIAPGVLAEVYAGSYLVEYPLITIIIGSFITLVAFIGHVLLLNHHSSTNNDDLQENIIPPLYGHAPNKSDDHIE